MTTTYKINLKCLINTKNPTPSRNDREVAVNIVPVRKNKRFENFLLAIENDQQCCEYWGYGLLDISDTNNIEEINGELEETVKTITVGWLSELPLEKKVVKDVVDMMIGSWYDTDEDNDIYASLIETKNKRLLAFVYNIHNGYYAHNIYYTNDELKLDVFEESCI